MASFDVQPQIHKNYDGAHIKGTHRVMLNYSHVLRAELISIAVNPSKSWIYRDLSTCWSKKTSKLRVTGLSEGNPPMTGGFPLQRASGVQNVSIWWRHHDSKWPTKSWEISRKIQCPMLNVAFSLQRIISPKRPLLKLMHRCFGRHFFSYKWLLFLSLQDVLC